MEDTVLAEDTQPTIVYEFAHWEGSKENIKPLKRGRNPAELKRAFAPLQPLQKTNQTTTETTSNDDTTCCGNNNKTTNLNVLSDPTIICFSNHNTKVKNSIERAEWELKIAAVTSHMSTPNNVYELGSEQDPLTTWIDYLTWIEDNYPTLDSSSQFGETLHRCTRLFASDARYKNHRRYVLLWLRYADTCKDPLDVFTFMHTNQIGLDVAEFYISWATALEDHRDFRAADSVLEQGYHRKAEPFKKMELSHESFKHRFMENIMKESMSDMSIHGDNNSPAQSTRNTGSNVFGGGMSAAGFGGGFSENQFSRVAFNPISQREANSGMRPTAMQTPTHLSPIRMNVRTNGNTTTVGSASRSTPSSITGFTRPRTAISSGIVNRRPASSANTLGGIRKKTLTNNAGSNFQVFDESNGSSTPASKKRKLLPSCMNIPAASTANSSLNQFSRILPFDLPQQPTASPSTSSTAATSSFPSWNYLPSEKESQKENHDLPTQWTNYRVIQQDMGSADQPASFALSHVKKPEEESCTFTVFEDEP